MRIFLTFSFLFLLAATENCVAQNYLVFRHKGKSYRPYIPGREIALTYQNSDFNYKIRGRIDSIGNDLIFVDGQKIYLENIKAVKIIRTAYNYKSGGVKLATGGVLLSILCATNAWGFREQRSFYIASGVLFVTGTLMFIVAERTFKLNENNQLLIIKPK